MPLREGRPITSAVATTPALQFLLTPLREGRLLLRLFCVRVDGISTHAPAGGATLILPQQSFTLHFYSRPCGRGDPAYHHDEILEAKFLLTPLREGRQINQMQIYSAKNISTHAPAGGATWVIFYGKVPEECISTHAPAGGATAKDANIRQALVISTHAPAGGATAAVQGGRYGVV